MMSSEPSNNVPVVQRHKASGEIWRRIERVGDAPRVVRVQREGKQRTLWLAYWLDSETWEAV